MICYERALKRELHWTTLLTEFHVLYILSEDFLESSIVHFQLQICFSIERAPHQIIHFTS